MPKQNKHKCSVCKKHLSISLFYTNKRAVSGFQSSCKPCAKKLQRAHSRTFQGRYKRAIYTAKKRKLKFTLSREEYLSLVSNCCAYCDGVLEQTGVGLDRIDSSKGYIPDNVTPCCYQCNMTKGDMTMEQFVNHIDTLYKKVVAPRRKP